MCRSDGQRSSLNCWCCLLIILWPFVWLPDFAILVDFREKIIPCYCFVGRHKVRVKLLVLISALSTQYFMNNNHTWYSGCYQRMNNSLYTCSHFEFLIITILGTVVATREWIIHCIHAAILNSALRRDLYFSNISCLYFYLFRF